MNPDSLVFINSLTLTLHAEDIPLDSILLTISMDGLNYPDKPVVVPPVV